MLDVFRHRKTLVRIVLGFIVFLLALSMVVYLIPGITGGNTTDPALGAVVAEVGGEKINAWELQQAMLQLVRSNRLPAEMTGLYTTQILNEMILEKLTAQEARRLGLRVEESELAAELRRNPDLFPDGKFIGQQLYENVIQQNFGTSVAQFEDRFRQALLVGKLHSLVTDPVTVSPQEVRDAFQEQNETMVVSYVFLDPAELSKEMKPSDVELKAYYEKNTARYQVPEKRSAKVVWILTDKVRQAIAIPEADVKRYYEDHKDSYRMEERVQVSHILLLATDKEPEKLAQAKKKSEELLRQLKAGADFAKLARENSADTASAANGGDIGWIVRQQTVPEFEQAAFSLPSGTLSDPIQTMYGIHILKVRAHEPARLRPLEDAQAEIRGQLLEDRTQAELPRLAAEAENALRRGGSVIEAVAEKYHGVVVAIPTFGMGEIIPALGQTLAFQQEVFSLQPKEVGRAIPVESGYMLPILQEIVPPHQGELAEVTDRVRTDWINEQAREKVDATAKELAGRLEPQEKKDLRGAVRALRLTLQTSEPLQRETPIPQAGKLTDVDPKAFARPVGDVAGPFSAGSGQIVYQVDSRRSPTEEEFGNQKSAVEERLLSEKRQLAFAVFQDTLRSKLTEKGNIKIHNAVLDRVTATNLPGS